MATRNKRPRIDGAEETLRPDPEFAAACAKLSTWDAPCACEPGAVRAVRATAAKLVKALVARVGELEAEARAAADQGGAPVLSLCDRDGVAMDNVRALGYIQPRRRVPKYCPTLVRDDGAVSLTASGEHAIVASHGHNSFAAQKVLPPFGAFCWDFEYSGQMWLSVWDLSADVECGQHFPRAAEASPGWIKIFPGTGLVVFGATGWRAEGRMAPGTRLLISMQLDLIILDGIEGLEVEGARADQNLPKFAEAFAEAEKATSHAEGEVALRKICQALLAEQTAIIAEIYAFEFVAGGYCAKADSAVDSGLDVACLEALDGVAVDQMLSQAARIQGMQTEYLQHLSASSALASDKRWDGAFDSFPMIFPGADGLFTSLAEQGMTRLKKLAAQILKMKTLIAAALGQPAQPTVPAAEPAAPAAIPEPTVPAAEPAAPALRVRTRRGPVAKPRSRK